MRGFSVQTLKQFIMEALLKHFDRPAYLEYVKVVNESLREEGVDYAKASRSDKHATLGHKHTYYFLTKNKAYRLRSLFLERYPKLNVELKNAKDADKAQKDLFITPKLQEFLLKESEDKFKEICIQLRELDQAPTEDARAAVADEKAALEKELQDMGLMGEDGQPINLSEELEKFTEDLFC